jgi:hypothetical protein
MLSAVDGWVTWKKRSILEAAKRQYEEIQETMGDWSSSSRRGED